MAIAIHMTKANYESIENHFPLRSLPITWQKFDEDQTLVFENVKWETHGTWYGFQGFWWGANEACLKRCTDLAVGNKSTKEIASN